MKEFSKLLLQNSHRFRHFWGVGSYGLGFTPTVVAHVVKYTPSIGSGGNFPFVKPLTASGFEGRPPFSVDAR
jgi:hypothetical protein